MIRAILIDLDGVVRRWPESDAALEAAHGLPPGAIRDVAFAASLVTPPTLGHVSDACWRENIVVRLHERFPSAVVRTAVAAWSARSGTVNRPVLSLLEERAPGVPLALVTNATSRLADDLETLGIARRFHAVINSSDVGVRKPAPEILRLALEAMDVAADEAFYIDDSPRNVEAARALGIPSHRFDGLAALADRLRSAPDPLDRPPPPPCPGR